jgi:N-acetylglucosaminyl-diphospho-decaprenol L-rhamnosyltransferase
MPGERPPLASAVRVDSARVTAIVVTHDSAGPLPACLAALRRERLPAIVVDNASSDGTPALAEGLGARIIRNIKNEGFGRANNIGIAAADSPLVLVINPDVVLEAGAGAALVDASDRYPDAALLAPRIVEPDGRLFFQSRSLLAAYLTNPTGEPCAPDGDCCAPFLSGACLLIRRDLFLTVGGFDETIFLFYEDDDLCRRLAGAGHALVHVHAAVARHARGASSRPRPGRIFTSRWHQAWSRAYVSRKYALANPAWRMLLINGPKTALACLTFRRSLIERYAGSAAGSLAFLRGQTALARHGLKRR